VSTENLDIVIALTLLIVGMYVPDIVRSIRRYRRVMQHARQITQEHEARRFLDEQWKAQ
jgi:hypothetical protein